MILITKVISGVRLPSTTMAMISVIITLLLPLTAVTANTHPNITIALDNINNVTEGDNITITCESMGNPLPTVTWSRTNGVLVGDSVADFIENQNASKVSRNLTIINASRDDTGVYTCSANNSVGSVSSNVSITVQFKAEIIDELEVIDQDYDLLENETNPVTFTCRAIGNPVPTISWYFSAINVSDGSVYNITTTVRGGVIESALTILSPQVSDAGIYICHAENVIGNDIGVRILTINVQFTIPPPIDNFTIVIIEGCFEETDPIYEITWPFTMVNTNATINCSDGTVATRLCGSVNSWQAPILSNCLSYEYNALLALRTQIEQAESAAAVTSGLNELTSQLAIVTNKTTGRTSSYPADLLNANSLLEFSLETIERNPSIILNSNKIAQNIVDCFSNMLDHYNIPGWLDLKLIDPSQSQMFLNNSEKFALLLAENMEAVGLSRTVESENIVIVAELVDPNSITDINFSGAYGNSLFIPASYIKQQQSEGTGVPVVNINYQNIEYILPPVPTQPISQILSCQVTDEPAVSTSNDTAVQLTFRYSDRIPSFGIQLICAFWNFSLNEGSGGWDTEGITVMEVNRNKSTITCNSTHLTSFAVILITDNLDNIQDVVVDVSIIVDVSGGHQDISQEERTALSAVSYVGCGISIICLLITVIILVYYRNSLFKGTHNFVHLNLALALLFALITFVSGVGTATGSEVGCTIVAALLHYFFTAVFTWMLCEGIMIYLLLVKIFRTDVGEKKLPYLALGWGAPVPIVAISAGVAHDQYGHDDFCWIDTEEGAIWGFVAPMLAVIIVNVIFLIMTIYSLYKNKRNKMTLEKTSQAMVVRGILKATVILLPLLGITWVFGLLAVNQESSVFAWIFTILNSLQGMFIFIFHVIRNDKMWQKISSCWKNKGKYNFIPSSLRSSTASRIAKTTTNIQTVSTDDDLSTSNRFQMQSKSDTSTTLIPSDNQSESKSEGLLVEAKNEGTDTCITDVEVKPKEEEILTKKFSLDIKVSTKYDETDL